MYLWIVLSTVFFVTGLCFFIFEPDFALSFFDFDVISSKNTGIALLIIFSLVLVAYFRKLMARGPAFIIDDRGVWKGRGETLKDRILWENMVGVYLKDLQNVNYVMFEINNAKEVLDSETPFFKRKTLAFIIRMNGLQLALTGATLDRSSEEIYEIIKNMHNEKTNFKN